MLQRFKGVFNFQQFGIILVIMLIGAGLTIFAGSHVDRVTGQMENKFLNAGTLLQVATDTAPFAIMAVGMTVVIITGGIDLSVGSIYSMAGVLSALLFQKFGITSPWLALPICCSVGALAGLLNGLMVVRLSVHPFIITLGTMQVYRGISFVTTNALSISVPPSLTDFIKSNLGLRHDLFPLPLLITLIVTAIGAILLVGTVWGRRVFAIGGNVEASRYSGVPVGRVLLSVYLLSGLTAGIAAFVGSSFFGSATSGDGTGYELYVIAGAVVGGASLTGGKGSALGGLLGALLIVMIRQSMRTLSLDQNYEMIIIGTAIVVAVVLDRVNSQLAQKRLTRS